jgi:hypothetical protein
MVPPDFGFGVLRGVDQLVGTPFDLHGLMRHAPFPPERLVYRE